MAEPILSSNLPFLPDPNQFPSEVQTSSLLVSSPGNRLDVHPNVKRPRGTMTVQTLCAKGVHHEPSSRWVRLGWKELDWSKMIVAIALSRVLARVPVTRARRGRA